jgi:hypothetical protein
MNRVTLRWLIGILTLITAAIHLGLAFVLEGGMQILFILNGIGYLVLLWALLRPPAFLAGYNTLVHYAFMLFTLVTIVGYFVVNGFALFDPGHVIDLVDKVVEVLLLIALFLHLRQS